MWRHLPEVVAAIGISKERHRVRHHPDVPALAVEVRHAPVAVLVVDANAVLPHRRPVRRVVVAIQRDACNGENESESVKTKPRVATTATPGIIVLVHW